MFAFVRTIRVPEAGSGGELRKRRGFLSAVLAGVLGFLVAFVESVFAFVRAIRVTMACAVGQGAHRRGLLTAIFTIVVAHDFVGFIRTQFRIIES